MHRRTLPGAMASLALLLGAGNVAAAPREEIYWPPISDPPTQTYSPGKWVWAELMPRQGALSRVESAPGCGRLFAAGCGYATTSGKLGRFGTPRRRTPRKAPGP